MAEAARIRKYIYRHCRIKAGFAVDFLVGTEMFHGVCRNVSGAGIRARFDRSVVVGCSGVVVLHKPGAALKLEARVVYTDGEEVGLDFSLKQHPESGKIVDLVAPILSAITKE